MEAETRNRNKRIYSDHRKLTMVGVGLKQVYCLFCWRKIRMWGLWTGISGIFCEGRVRFRGVGVAFGFGRLANVGLRIGGVRARRVWLDLVENKEEVSSIEVVTTSGKWQNQTQRRSSQGFLELRRGLFEG